MTPIGAGNPKLTYWIDPSGTVLGIEGPWDVWLGSEGKPPDRCCAERVVGNSLLSFIEDDGVRSVYEAIHARVLATGKPIEFSFRCDSPWLRRDMRMTISREGDALRYDSIVVGETRRQSPLPSPASKAETLIPMCSFCKAYRFPAESPLWKDIESLLTEPDLPARFAFTHGICQPCASLWFPDL